MSEAPRLIPAPFDRRARIVRDFLRAGAAAASLARLRAALGETVRALGFHHTLLQGADGEVWLADMPADWHPPHPAQDAVLAAAIRSQLPFAWSDIGRLITLTGPRQAGLDRAAASGIGAAVSIPIHRGADAGGYGVFAGCCTLAMRGPAPLPPESLAAAHYVAASAFGVAEMLRGVDVPGEQDLAPRLTPRQRDCVVLVARGKSDWEVGQLLGISESTVHKHIEDAKRRFGVSTRIQLVVQSLFEAKLTFAEIMAAPGSA